MVAPPAGTAARRRGLSMGRCEKERGSRRQEKTRTFTGLRPVRLAEALGNPGEGSADWTPAAGLPQYGTPAGRLERDRFPGRARLEDLVVHVLEHAPEIVVCDAPIFGEP